MLSCLMARLQRLVMLGRRLPALILGKSSRPPAAIILMLRRYGRAAPMLAAKSTKMERSLNWKVLDP